MSLSPESITYYLSINKSASKFHCNTDFLIRVAFLVSSS